MDFSHKWIIPVTCGNKKFYLDSIDDNNDDNEIINEKVMLDVLEEIEDVFKMLKIK